MDQGWFSVFGLSLDIVGFGLLVREWTLATAPARLERLQREIDWFEDARGRGPAVRFTADDLRAHDVLLTDWRKNVELEKSRLHLEPHRERLFHAGAVLIFLGFILQLLGSLPALR